MMRNFLKLFSRILTYGVLLFVLVITIYPVIWMISGSLKNNYEFFQNIWGFSRNPHFNNFVSAWNRGALGQKYINSIIVTVFSLLIIIPVNSCAAYAIARLDFKWKKFIYTFLLIGIMIPSGILAIPVFSVALSVNLVNSLYGLVIIYAAQAVSFGTFIMRSFFISLPKSLEEAAEIDGCTKFKSFLFVILPLAVPGIMTQVIFSGLNIWNEYLLASILIRSDKLKTLPLGLATFVNQYNVDYPELFAALVCVMVPVILIYLVGQKSFIEGMTAGAVKG